VDNLTQLDIRIDLSLLFIPQNSEGVIQIELDSLLLAVEHLSLLLDAFLRSFVSVLLFKLRHGLGDGI